MKINKKIKDMSVKAVYVLLAICISTTVGHSQSKGKGDANRCVKKVIYQAIEFNKMSINDKNSFSSLSDYDYNYADPDALSYEVEICVDKGGNVSFLKTYEKMGDGKFGVGYNINKVEISSSGIRSYNFRGVLINTAPLENSKSLRIPLDKISSFGLYDLVEFDREMKQKIKKAGGDYFQDEDGFDHICNKSNMSELIYSSDELLFAEYYYDNNGAIITSTLKQYRSINRSKIPAFEIRKRYELGTNDTKIQIERIKKYMAYKVESNGKIIVDYIDNKTSKYGGVLDNDKPLPIGKFDIKKMPILDVNVTFINSKIKIDIPVFESALPVNLKIFNNLNEEIYCISRLQQNSSFVLDFKNYSKGYYRIECTNGIEDSTLQFTNTKESKS